MPPASTSRAAVGCAGKAPVPPLKGVRRVLKSSPLVKS